MSFFQPFYVMKLKTSKVQNEEASEGIITKFKSQGVYIIRIKCWNASGSGPPPSLIPTLWNIGILHYKQAKLPKHLQHSVYVFLLFIWYACYCNFKLHATAGKIKIELESCIALKLSVFLAK